MTGAPIQNGDQDAGPRRGRAPGRRGMGAAAAFLAAMLLAAAPLGPKSAARGAAPADPLATLKVGHWVRMEGPLHADSTGLCEELRLLTGDFLDDDWAIRGYVTAVDTSKHEIVIAGIRIQVTEDTGFDSPKKNFRVFSDLRAGMLLEAEGAYLKHRRLVAGELDDESDDIPRIPWAKNRIRVVAKVERVDTRRRLVTAMGFVFQMTDRTRIRTVIE